MTLQAWRINQEEKGPTRDDPWAGPKSAPKRGEETRAAPAGVDRPLAEWPRPARLSRRVSMPLADARATRRH